MEEKKEFPVDFMFQLSEYELENLRSQTIILRAVHYLTHSPNKAFIC